MADYFVDGDSVLENKLDITDPDDFKAAEQEIVTNKSADILSELPQAFGLDYLLDYSQVTADELIGADKHAFEGDIGPLLSVYGKVVTK